MIFKSTLLKLFNKFTGINIISHDNKYFDDIINGINLDKYSANFKFYNIKESKIHNYYLIKYMTEGECLTYIEVKK